MNIYLPLINEFIARKEHILNLEIRLFILTLVIQFLFILFVLFEQKKMYTKILPLLSVPFFFLLLQSIAINGKMGLISNYLKQLEVFLNKQGFLDTIWESKALDLIVFPVGNAFTLPAFFALIIILFESYYILKHSFAILIQGQIKRILVTIFLFIILIMIVIKSLTVDFFAIQPSIFLI